MTDPSPVQIQPEADLTVNKSAERATPPPVLTINIYSWATPIAGLLMLILGLAAGFWGRPLLVTAAGTSSAAAQVTPVAAAADTGQRPEVMEVVLPQTRHFIGDPNAPITLIEFSDYQCPYCGKFAAAAWQEIYEEYVKDGRVRMGFVHFAFLGPESSTAAQASECAAEQDKFWEYHDLLFSNQGQFSEANFKKFAGQLGLDQKSFDSCLDSGKYADLVTQQTQFAQELGVRSTPSFIINGQPVIGAQPFENFAQVIESQLASR